MESVSDAMEEHWRALRNANLLLIAASAGYLVHAAARSRQVRAGALTARDFSSRRVLDVGVRGLLREDGFVVARCVHQPRFVPRALLGKDASYELRVRLFGVRATEGPDCALQCAPESAALLAHGRLVAQLLSEAPAQNSGAGKEEEEEEEEEEGERGDKGFDVVGHILYHDLSRPWYRRVFGGRLGSYENLALHLVRTGQANAAVDEAPGPQASQDPRHMRDMARILTALESAERAREAPPEDAGIASRPTSLLGRLREQVTSRLKQ